MSLPRLEDATHIADQLNQLAAMVKTRSRASLTDANHLLETIATRFFNVLFGWGLVNLNSQQANYPAADLGDRTRRIAMQVTNEDSSDKIRNTTTKAIEHQLGTDFDLLIVFFLLPRKPGFPKEFLQPPNGPKIQTWDIPDLLRQLQDLPDLKALSKAASVLDEELGMIAAPETEPKCEISRIIKYAPAELIGRERELNLLNDAWAKVRAHESNRPHLLTFVALGGEGKTSLVAKWAANLAHMDWPGCEVVFAWSFYSQGTREQTAVSSDAFLAEALIYFGDVVMAGSAQGAFDKGRRLAHLVGKRRALLILDGLEPLQYAPTSPTPGELKDQGLVALLKGLAATSHGLCVVTTRYSIPDLRTYWQTTAPEVKLTRLSTDAGVALLKSFGVIGSLKNFSPRADSHQFLNEFEKLVEDVKGHALTLNLLGSYLRDAHGGDIRRRDLINLEEADAEEQGGHAFRVMDAYVRSFENEGEQGLRALALLRTLGLFDRPGTADCLHALWSGAAIAGLTEPLTSLSEAHRNLTLRRLEGAKLLTIQRDEATGVLVALDAHPLLREYFARRLREGQPEAWRSAHRRLYEHLCESAPQSTKIHWLARIQAPGSDTNPTLEDLELLYQAVVHACYAGLYEEAWTNIFQPRILRGDRFYSYQKLGAVSSDLWALASFFEVKWSRISSTVTNSTRGRVLNAAGLRLRLLGRLTEALEAHREAVKVEGQQDPLTSLRNLSELELELGDITSALKSSQRCVSGAKDRVPLIMFRTLYGNALHQSGYREEANNQFASAEPEELQLLHSLSGFWYFDLLLGGAERSVWQRILGVKAPSAMTAEKRGASSRNCTPTHRKNCQKVARKAASALKALKSQFGPLDIALYQLASGRAALYGTILKSSSFQLNTQTTGFLKSANLELDDALDNLYRSGTMHQIPGVLLTRGCLRFLTGAHTGPESAQSDFEEAWDIARRGPMKLFVADTHLHRARLFFGAEKYPWKTPATDLEAAERLINDCGYHRRDEELADAKHAILGT